MNEIENGASFNTDHANNCGGVTNVTIPKLDNGLALDFSSVMSTSSRPDQYRLAKMPNGEVVLQGLFSWFGTDKRGCTAGGSNWRDLPTVDLTDDDEERG